MDPGGELFVSCCSCGLLHRPEDDRAMHSACDRCRRPDGSGSADGRAVHTLSENAIDDVVRDTAPGTFVLGYRDGSAFVIHYVGRSDSDVGARLRAWVEAPSRPRPAHASSGAPSRSRSGAVARLGTRALGRTSVGVDTAYTHFSFRYAASALAAFERECRDYHAIGASNLDNPRHPIAPTGVPAACPVHGLPG